MTDNIRVGVFGGTFDPIHIGHLAVVQDASWHLSLDRVLFVPNRHPPHKDGLKVSDVRHRLAMVELAIADNPLFELSTIELDRLGPSYTLATMRTLNIRLGSDVCLYFLVGCDALGQLHSWHRPDALLDEFQLVIMDRPTGTSVAWEEIEKRFPRIRSQVKVVHTMELEISSVEIRRRVAEGKPIWYHVVPSVERYIRRHNLYAASRGND